MSISVWLPLLCCMRYAPYRPYCCRSSQCFLPTVYGALRAHAGLLLVHDQADAVLCLHRRATPKVEPLLLRGAPRALGCLGSLSRRRPMAVVKGLFFGSPWLAALLCFALAEYWGVVHVRTVQSRWVFPRVVLLLQGGVLVYVTWWPHCPGWILSWSLLSSQLWLMWMLLCQFDCFVTLPEQAPHRLLYRSSLLPAAQLVREQPATGMNINKELDKAHRVVLHQLNPGRGAPRATMVSRGTQTEDTDCDVAEETSSQVEQTQVSTSEPSRPRECENAERIVL